MAEIQKRGCTPLESFIFTIRLQMWPIFQKAMQDNIDSVKRYAEGSSSGYFRAKVTTTDAVVSTVRICPRYSRSLLLIDSTDLQTICRDVQFFCCAYRPVR